MTIWENKAMARIKQVEELIDALATRRDEQAVIFRSSLEYYARTNPGLPHNAWVAIRKEVIDKATAFLEWENK